MLLLKAGSKLNRLVALLEEMDLIDHAVMFSYIGSEDERVETDLRRFRNETTGYMTLIIVKKSQTFQVDDDEEEAAAWNTGRSLPATLAEGPGDRAIG
ncbi:MAG TPA: hypothetical protein VMV69_11980 [Pirellulales bacterium]|nr:hypothetical protein [Pirellulales bacterium]